MLQQWERMLTGVFYALFGTPGLEWFHRHGALLSLLLLAGLICGALGLAWWLLNRLRRSARQWECRLRLFTSADGRQALRQARGIRRDGARLLTLLRELGPAAQEVSELAAPVRGFLRDDLPRLLQQVLGLLQRDAPKRRKVLEHGLEQATGHWARLEPGPERNKLAQAMALLRHQLSKLEEAATQRNVLLDGLNESADALRDLTVEVAALNGSRSSTQPSLATDLRDVTGHLRDLRKAYQSLEAPAEPASSGNRRA